MTAEQLLPWLDVSDPGDPDSVVVEESYVVPVLQRFQGSPLVGATGGLLYEFPSFQTSAALKAQAGVEGGFLVEDAWRFSAATKGQLVGAGALVRTRARPSALQRIGSRVGDELPFRDVLPPPIPPIPPHQEG